MAVNRSIYFNIFIIVVVVIFIVIITSMWVICIKEIFSAFLILLIGRSMNVVGG